tara:strand:+ start:188 stop:502 length:315 start_codon:yes stop_codon:yes gene_type:complete
MKHYKDYFKSRKEVEQYFGNDFFKFLYISDNIIEFESLNPVMLEDGLFTFTLLFYYDNVSDFFCYSSFNDWFGKFQLSEVTLTSEQTHNTETMFFSKYVDFTNN